jgi:hypothetical protein
VLDLDAIKNALKTGSTMTAFRKLKQLSYLSSYSHRGKFYTLREIADFNDKGLWLRQSIGFSRYGNLIETTKAFVDISEIGYGVNELNDELQVQTQEALLHLFREGHIYREKISGVFIYLSIDKKIRERQFLLRQKIESVPTDGLSINILNHELKAAIVLFFSLLDEKQRRIYAGLESFKLGYGGDKKIADLLGLNVHTVAKGRRELFGSDIRTEGVRKKGAGRKTVEKKSQKLSEK